MNTKHKIIYIYLLCHCLLIPHVLFGKTGIDYILKGKWSVQYTIQDPQEKLILSEIHTRGFDQTFKKIHRGYLVTVTTDLSPIIITIPFTFQSGKLPPECQDQTLITSMQEVTSMSDAVREVLAWVDKTAPYNEEASQSQTWKDVLQRHFGNCVGRSNLAIEILKSMDISCRPVSGCLVNNQKSVFHRWMEVDYPEIGALQSEPGVTQDFISPYHIVLAPTKEVDPTINDLSDIGVQIEIIEEQKDVWTIDQKTRPDLTETGIQRRLTTSTRNMGAVVGKIVPLMGTCRIELKTRDELNRQEVDRYGNFSFTGLPAGGYILNVTPSWGRSEMRQGVLASGELNELSIKIYE